MNTELIVILDKSGSMSQLRTATISGFNEFLEDQKQQAGQAKVTLVLFSSAGLEEQVLLSKPMEEVEPLGFESFICEGMTALRDAIGKTLYTERIRIEQQDWADKVIVVIMTDGGENNSRFWSKEETAKLISELEENNWKFIYTGANQDSFLVAEGLGMTSAVVSNYTATAEGTQTAYRNLSASVSALRV